MYSIIGCFGLLEGFYVLLCVCVYFVFLVFFVLCVRVLCVFFLVCCCVCLCVFNLKTTSNQVCQGERSRCRCRCLDAAYMFRGAVSYIAVNGSPPPPPTLSFDTFYKHTAYPSSFGRVPPRPSLCPIMLFRRSPYRRRKPASRATAAWRRAGETLDLGQDTVLVTRSRAAS